MMTFLSAPSLLLPYCAPCCNTVLTTAWREAAVRRRLMKPGPAISADSIKSRFAGLSRRAATSACATSRGFFLSGLAICIARLQATSPCDGSRGRSSVTVGLSSVPAISGATAAWKSSVMRCFCAASMDLFLTVQDRALNWNKRRPNYTG